MNNNITNINGKNERSKGQKTRGNGADVLFKVVEVHRLRKETFIDLQTIYPACSFPVPSIFTAS